MAAAVAPALTARPDAFRFEKAAFDQPYRTPSSGAGSAFPNTNSNSQQRNAHAHAHATASLASKKRTLPSVPVHPQAEGSPNGYGSRNGTPTAHLPPPSSALSFVFGRDPRTSQRSTARTPAPSSSSSSLQHHHACSPEDASAAVAYPQQRQRQHQHRASLASAQPACCSSNSIMVSTAPLSSPALSSSSSSASPPTQAPGTVRRHHIPPLSASASGSIHLPPSGTTPGFPASACKGPCCPPTAKRHMSFAYAYPSPPATSAASAAYGHQYSPPSTQAAHPGFQHAQTPMSAGYPGVTYYTTTSSSGQPQTYVVAHPYQHSQSVARSGTRPHSKSIGGASVSRLRRGSHVVAPVPLTAAASTFGHASLSRSQPQHPHFPRTPQHAQSLQNSVPASAGHAGSATRRGSELAVMKVIHTNPYPSEHPTASAVQPVWHLPTSAASRKYAQSVSARTPLDGLTRTDSGSASVSPCTGSSPSHGSRKRPASVIDELDEADAQMDGSRDALRKSQRRDITHESVRNSGHDDGVQVAQAFPAMIKEEELEPTLLPPAVQLSQLQSGVGHGQHPALHASSISTTPVQDAVRQRQRQDSRVEGPAAMSGVSDFVDAAETHNAVSLHGAPLRMASLPALLPSHATGTLPTPLDVAEPIHPAPARAFSMPPVRRPASAEAFSASHPGMHVYRHSQAHMSPDGLAAHLASPFRLAMDGSRPLVVDEEVGRGPGVARAGEVGLNPSAATGSASPARHASTLANRRGPLAQERGGNLSISAPAIGGAVLALGDDSNAHDVLESQDVAHSAAMRTSYTFPPAAQASPAISKKMQAAAIRASLTPRHATFPELDAPAQPASSSNASPPSARAPAPYTVQHRPMYHIPPLQYTQQQQQRQQTHAHQLPHPAAPYASHVRHHPQPPHTAQSLAHHSQPTPIVAARRHAASVSAASLAYPSPPARRIAKSDFLLAMERIYDALPTSPGAGQAQLYQIIEDARDTVAGESRSRAIWEQKMEERIEHFERSVSSELLLLEKKLEAARQAQHQHQRQQSPRVLHSASGIAQAGSAPMLDETMTDEAHNEGNGNDCTDQGEQQAVARTIRPTSNLRRGL